MPSALVRSRSAATSFTAHRDCSSTTVPRHVREPDETAVAVHHDRPMRNADVEQLVDRPIAPTSIRSVKCSTNATELLASCLLIWAGESPRSIQIGR